MSAARPPAQRSGASGEVDTFSTGNAELST